MYALLKKILFLLEPELAHALVKRSGNLLPKPVLKRFTKTNQPELACRIGDIPLQNPIGLAAGFDKNAEMIEWMAAMGFGFLEIGSITAEPYNGNPKPRIFRLPKDQSLINRMGLPNLGSEAIARNLKKNRSAIPLGINIAKTPSAKKGEGGRFGIEDMLETLNRVHSFGAYITFNLSCPNTLDGKTFEDPVIFERFAKLLDPARAKLRIKKPVLIKLSPTLDKSNLRKLVEKACAYDIDGFVLSNTTPERPHLQTSKSRIGKVGPGGLSGRALLEPANQQLKAVYEIVGKHKILMGVGGIMDFEGVLQKLSLGAGLFQIYTGFIYKGPFFVHQLNQKLAAFCRKTGVKNYRDLIGEKEIVQAY